MDKRITQVYFSPSGTSEKISTAFSSTSDNKIRTINLLKEKSLSIHNFDQEDLLVVTLPVFSGRIPSVCVPMLEKMQGNSTPAIAMVVYGNREYDDALVELVDILEGCGFYVIGAGAFIAKHSIFPDVASKRPDESDILLVKDFALKCFENIGKIPKEKIHVKGNRPYKELKVNPMKPKGNSNCIKCNICVNICPTGAIDISNPRKTDKDKCISCTACIYHCPENARSFDKVMYTVANKSFVKANSKPKKSETFFAEYNNS